MLLRRPVVATPVGGIKDLIRDGYNGFFFPVRDYKTLADKIEMIYRDSRLAEKLVENGYKTATERFSPGAHTRRITNALTCAVRSSKN
jgi:glycosyltransferase involved in cell wall biosynthesis